MFCLPPCRCVPHSNNQVRRDTIILAESTDVVAGADTHLDTIHAAAISTTGTVLGDKEFPTTRAGYAAAIAFLMTLGLLCVSEWKAPPVTGSVHPGPDNRGHLCRGGDPGGQVHPTIQRQVRSPRRRQRRPDRVGRRRIGHP